MITPQDIQTKEFSKGVRGYKEEDVDIFLDELTIQLDAMIKENEALKAQIAKQDEKIAEYRNQEGAVIKTLETAKSLMNDLSASAEKRADILIRNAEIDAASMIRQAKANLVNLQAEEKMLLERVTTLKKNFKTLLESELSRFDEMSAVTSTIESANFEEANQQFSDLISSVNTADAHKDFFDDEAFKTKQDDLTKTIVTMENHSKAGN